MFDTLILYIFDTERYACVLGGLGIWALIICKNTNSVLFN